MISKFQNFLGGRMTGVEMTGIRQSLKGYRNDGIMTGVLYGLV